MVGDSVDGTYEGSTDGASDEHGLLVPAVGRPDGAVDRDLEELVGAPEGPAVTAPPLQSAGMGPCTTAP